MWKLFRFSNMFCELFWFALYDCYLMMVTCNLCLSVRFLWILCWLFLAIFMLGHFWIIFLILVPPLIYDALAELICFILLLVISSKHSKSITCGLIWPFCFGAEMDMDMNFLHWMVWERPFLLAADFCSAFDFFIHFETTSAS